MKSGVTRNPFQFIAHYVLGVLLLLGPAARGGGGGSPGVTGGAGSGTGSGGGTGTTSDGSVTVTMASTTGAASNTVSVGSPLVASATVKNAAGAPVKNVVVTFTVSSPIAVLSPTAGTALTDSNGIAQIGLESGGIGAGAAEIIASATIVGTTAVTGKAGFVVGMSPTATPAAINFLKASPADRSIVIKGAGGNGRTEVALLTFSVVDSSNSGVANKKVNFSTQSNQPVTLVNTSGTTNQNGEVTATINSGTLPTTVRVIATVDGTNISALSDTVTVTTGLPVQAAFSLSVETFNISGWNHDNEKTKINILMADASNNPVADGTPVVFQTDSGAVGSSDIGGCLTVNGACSVEFRSQAPRYGVGNTAGKTPGVATITASSTSAGSTLTGQINVVLSGDTPHVFSSGTEMQGGESFSTTRCSDYLLPLELRDVNSNPLPAGTKVEAVSLTDVSVSEIFPATVPNTLSPSVHVVPVKPDATKCAAGGGHTGSFSIKITPPLGTAVVYPFTLEYP